jgi:hypothetical protein
MTCHLPTRRSPGPRRQFISSALRFFALATLPFALCFAVPAQDSSPAPQAPAAGPASDSKSEISMHDSESTFQLHVNLV